MVPMARCSLITGWDIMVMRAMIRTMYGKIAQPPRMPDLVELLLEPFAYSFMIRALAVSIFVGVMCPILGSYVVNRGLGFMGDALAHSVLPGMILALILGVSPLVGAVPMGIVVALAIGYLSKKAKIAEDTSTGILFAGLFALGLIMVPLAGNVSISVEDILLGQVLGVSNRDVAMTCLLAALVLIVISVFHRQLVFVSFDPVGATVIGLPTKGLDYLLFVLLSIVIVVALQAVGIVLVVAMLITPAAAAGLIARRFNRAIALGVVFGVLSTVSGLYLSYFFDLPSGPSMTLVSTGIFLLAATKKKILVR
jgi:manganese/iron transport system permease protein